MPCSGAGRRPPQRPRGARHLEPALGRPGPVIRLPEIAARATLQSVLDAEVGEEGGDDGSALIARLDEALHELTYKADGRAAGTRRRTTRASPEARDCGSRSRCGMELERDLNELESVREYERLTPTSGPKRWNRSSPVPRRDATSSRPGTPSA